MEMEVRLRERRRKKKSPQPLSLPSARRLPSWGLEGVEACLPRPARSERHGRTGGAGGQARERVVEGPFFFLSSFSPGQVPTPSTVAGVPAACDVEEVLILL